MKKSRFSLAYGIPNAGVSPPMPPPLRSLPNPINGGINAPSGATMPGVQRQQITAQEANWYASQNFVPVMLQPEELYGAMLGAYDSIYAVSSYKYAQFNPDKLLAREGYKIYDEMLTLAACSAPYQIKLGKVLGNVGMPTLNQSISSSAQIIPAVTDPEDPEYALSAQIAESIVYTLDNIAATNDLRQSFRSVLQELASATWYGFHVSEINYKIFETGPYAGKTGLEYIASKPAQEIGWELDLMTLQIVNVMPYTPLGSYEPPRPVEKLLIYVYNPTRGLPFGTADARASHKHYLIISNLLKFWSMALERWGSPILIVQYPAGQPAALQAAQSALDAIRQGAQIVLPDNLKYELVTITAPALDSFKTACDWHAAQISQNVLGSTLTMSEGVHTGSMALGHVHEDTTDSKVDQVRADLMQVIYLQLLRRLVRINFGEEKEHLTPFYYLGSPDMPTKALEIAQSIDYLVRSGNLQPWSPIVRSSLNLRPQTAQELAWTKEHSVPPDEAVKSGGVKQPYSGADEHSSRRNGAAALAPSAADKGLSE